MARNRRIDLISLSARAETARELASGLLGDASCQESVPCLEREARSFLGHTRGFDRYDPTRLCASCCAYWHAELAAQALEGMVKVEARLRATERATTMPPDGKVSR